MSNLRRFFVDAISEPLYLTGEEFRHAVHVLRIKEGEEVIVCDNSSFEYVCKVKKITKTDMLLEVENKRQAVTEPKQMVCLLSGYLKGDKTELVVQKAIARQRCTLAHACDLHVHRSSHQLVRQVEPFQFGHERQ
jgi:16S rRNA U1498 N3-methylase RsmE